MFTRLVCFFLLFFLLSFSAAGSESVEKPRIGLALSGGGAKGLAHIGVLKVLEETGIQFDYITGTSMGSIVGGLYAIGYSAADLEEMATSQDWDKILLDQISRKCLSLEEKNLDARYAGSFPISEYRISLPTGLIAGQKVSMLLSELTQSVHHIEDFDQLPIPFRCVATNIVQGKAVVLDSGYLADAIRASMSIPSVFVPIEIEGQMLVDGGLIRNFPVSDVIDMGADFVIGVDVGAPLYTRKQLDSLVKIMNQSIGLAGAETTKKERLKCDVLIEPDVKRYNIMSFDAVDSLIILGEKAAREKLPELITLAELQGRFPQPEKIIPKIKIDSLFLVEIHIQGLRKVSKNLIRGKLQLEDQYWITPDQLDEAIERVYGSGYFERVSYKLEPTEGGVKLFIRIVEKTTDLLQFGFHYDNDMKSSVLLNTTFRNVLLQGSKFMVDIRLSENEALQTSYFVHTGWKPGFGFGINYDYENLEILLYDQNGSLEANYDYKRNLVQLKLETIFANSYALGCGFQGEHTRLEPLFVPDYYPDDIDTSDYINIFGYLQIDTLDKSIYPTRGVKLEAEAMLVNPVEESASPEPFRIYKLYYREILEIEPRLALIGDLKMGKIDGDQVPPDFYFYMGGLNRPTKGLIPLTGYKYMFVSTRNFAVIGAALQFEPWDNKYVIFSADYARIGTYFSDIFDQKNSHYGLGMTLGIITPIGPVEYTLMTGKEEEDLLSYINIGYNF